MLPSLCSFRKSNVTILYRFNTFSMVASRGGNVYDFQGTNKTGGFLSALAPPRSWEPGVTWIPSMGWKESCLSRVGCGVGTPRGWASWMANHEPIRIPKTWLTLDIPGGIPLREDVLGMFFGGPNTRNLRRCLDVWNNGSHGWHCCSFPGERSRGTRGCRRSCCRAGWICTKAAQACSIQVFVTELSRPFSLRKRHAFAGCFNVSSCSSSRCDIADPQDELNSHRPANGPGCTFQIAILPSYFSSCPLLGYGRPWTGIGFGRRLWWLRMRGCVEFSKLCVPATDAVPGLWRDGRAPGRRPGVPRGQPRAFSWPAWLRRPVRRSRRPPPGGKVFFF